MVESFIVLDDAIPEELVGDLEDKLAYASEHVRRCEIDARRTRVSIAVDDPGVLPGALACVRAVIEALLRGYRPVAREVSWRHHARTPCRGGPVWDQLAARGLVHREAQGCVSLLGDACRVALALDRRFEAIAAAFGAVPHQYPTLLPIAALERCDYFASFPHHVTFAPHLVEDVERIRHVGGCEAGARPGAIAAALATPTHVLSPSVCFHTYAALADSYVANNCTFTAVNRCYRWESKNLATLERLWDFTMREIVFVGDPEWVEAERERAVTETARLVEELDLEAWVETANDPFFVGNYAAKRYFQLLRRAKLELRFAIGDTGTSLAASCAPVSWLLARAPAATGIPPAALAFAETVVHTAGFGHLAIALLLLHGIDERLPVRAPLLATSYVELWSRFLVHLKDLQVAVFYAPALLACRRLDRYLAIVIAIAWTMLVGNFAIHAVVNYAFFIADGTLALDRLAMLEVQNAAIGAVLACELCLQAWRRRHGAPPPARWRSVVGWALTMAIATSVSALA